jgi:transposase
MESMGKKPRRRRSFTPEFKAEIIELCQRGDRSVGQVAKDSDQHINTGRNPAHTREAAYSVAGGGTSHFWRDSLP